LALEKGKLNRTDRTNGVDAFLREYDELIRRKRDERKELEKKHRKKHG
jgi:hypothetical protein